MNVVSASAPGKLILLGEHAAVYGRPALVAAVDRRVRATFEPRPGTTEVDLLLPALGFTRRLTWQQIEDETEAARRRWQRWCDNGPGPYEGAPATPEGAVVIALGETALAVGAAGAPRAAGAWSGGTLEIRSDVPIGGGFGSSAALAASVAAACLAARGIEPRPRRVAPIALACERRCHGRPSGIDHTTVLNGGFLWFERDEEGLLAASPLEPVPGLLDRLRVFDSGRPRQTTGEVVAAVRRLAEARAPRGQPSACARLPGDQGLPRSSRPSCAKSPGEFRALLDQIEAATRGARTVLAAPDLRGPREALLRQTLRLCEAALERLGVVPEAVRRHIRAAERRGGAAKISGAGALSGRAAGGVLVLTPPEQSPEAVASGMTSVPVRWGAPGLSVEAG